MWDALWLDAHLACMTTEAPYGAIEKAAIAARNGRIVFAGPEAELPGRPEDLALRVERLDGRWITPGLIDCHVHLDGHDNYALGSLAAAHAERRDVLLNRAERLTAGALFPADWTREAIRDLRE